jgi:glyoxalase family protein
VKTTVNFDDPSTYHLYFGDETGSPGTILTFFPFGSGYRGRVGKGQVSATAFAVPEGSIEFWRDRLDDRGVDADEHVERFGETVLPFRDGDGQPLELVESASPVEPWSDGPIPAEHAMRGFFGITISSARPDATGSVLGRLGYEHVEEEGDRTRYRTAGDCAAVVDLHEPDDGMPGRQGGGTVHHVAFRTPDDEAQFAWRERLIDTGLSVTGQKDRQYFRSIYFREPGGVLFEIATDGPGFSRDEAVDELGSALKLPPWLEEDREFLEERLPEIEIGTPAEAD